MDGIWLTLITLAMLFASFTVGLAVQPLLGRVDKPREGDSPDALRCDSKLIFVQEIGGDPGTVERRRVGAFRAVRD